MQLRDLQILEHIKIFFKAEKTKKWKRTLSCTLKEDCINLYDAKT